MCEEEFAVKHVRAILLRQQEEEKEKEEQEASKLAAQQQVEVAVSAEEDGASAGSIQKALQQEDLVAEVEEIEEVEADTEHFRPEVEFPDLYTSILQLVEGEVLEIVVNMDEVVRTLANRSKSRKSKKDSPTAVDSLVAEGREAKTRMLNDSIENLSHKLSSDGAGSSGRSSSSGSRGSVGGSNSQNIDCAEEVEGWTTEPELIRLRFCSQLLRKVVRQSTFRIHFYFLSDFGRLFLYTGKRDDATRAAREFAQCNLQSCGRREARPPLGANDTPTPTTQGDQRMIIHLDSCSTSYIEALAM
jgi:hypothetical protein